MLLFVCLLFSSKRLKICKMSSISTAGFSGSRRCLQTGYGVCILTGLFVLFFLSRRFNRTLWKCRGGGVGGRVYM